VSVPVLDGTEVLAVLTCFARVLHHDQFQAIGLLTDVATQTGQFLARRRAEELAEELRRARADFTALIGHDMRTPLTTIATYTQLLLDDPDPRPAADQQLLDGIDRNATVLRELVEGLLDITALECDDDALPAHVVDFTALLTRTAHDLHARARETAHQPQLSLAPSIEVTGDPGRLRQLADKLLAIAIDASPAAPHRPQVSLQQAEDMAELVVTSGHRLAPRQANERFSAANTTGTGDTGTRIGIGLVLARIITERHGGTLEVTDHTSGSAIRVRLPLHPSGPGATYPG
jgi:signal transduction histidine kinase